MNPSTALSGAAPARQAASAASQASRGSSSPAFRLVETSEWNSVASPSAIASW